MANQTTHSSGGMHIILDGTTDWSYIADGGFAEGIGIKIASVQFNPSAANDVLVIRDKVVATGTIVHKLGPSAGTENLKDYNDPPEWEFPVIDASDLTLGTPANASVIIRYV